MAKRRGVWIRPLKMVFGARKGTARSPPPSPVTPSVKVLASDPVTSAAEVTDAQQSGLGVGGLDGLGPPREPGLVGAVRPDGPRGQHPACVGVSRQDPAQQADAADAVDLGVVGLHVERPAVLLQALDHVALPERVAPVHLGGVQPRDQHPELPLGARTGQGRVAQVVVQVDLVVRQLGPAGHRGHLEQVVVRRPELAHLAPPVDEVLDEGRLAVRHPEGGEHPHLHRGPVALGEEPGRVVDLEQLAGHLASLSSVTLGGIPTPGHRSARHWKIPGTRCRGSSANPRPAPPADQR